MVQLTELTLPATRHGTSDRDDFVAVVASDVRVWAQTDRSLGGSGACPSRFVSCQRS